MGENYVELFWVENLSRQFHGKRKVDWIDMYKFRGMNMI